MTIRLLSETHEYVTHCRTAPKRHLCCHRDILHGFVILSDIRWLVHRIRVAHARDSVVAGSDKL